MKRNKLPLSGMMLVGIIIIATFIYGIEVQPVATGEQILNIYQLLKMPANQDLYGEFFEFLTPPWLLQVPWWLLNGGSNTYELRHFSSYVELCAFFKSNYQNVSGYMWCCDAGAPSVRLSQSLLGESVNNGGSSVDYSQTNIQVEGVDEPDIVKTDGTYLYILAHSKIFIVRAYPAEDADVLSEISLDTTMYPMNVFINDDRLIIFGTSTRHPQEYNGEVWPRWGGIPSTMIKIYDVADRENPELVQDVEIDGGYFDSRMIGDYVYVIATESTYNIYQILDDNETITIPKITINEDTRKIPADHIYYVNIPERIDTMTHVLSINLKSEEVNQKSFLLGSSQNMYVSTNHIFLAYTKYEYLSPLEDSYPGWSAETTILHKISIDDGDISYVAQGEIPGRVLNQFSMDEYDGFFRIATTIGHVWDHDAKSTNNVYILDKDLSRVSEIEDIAPGERIYSARFISGKAYLVTFKKIDPFFTLDLSDPYNPQVLGKLKIPGYSDYLHPYDENHIIGIGKDTVEALDVQKENRNLDFAWYQGLKIALFDVSDFENPQEVAKIVIGDRGTDSPALYDHKAFLFDREKQLLVIPVSVYEISDDIKAQYDNYTGSMYGEFTFQGAYVYRLSVDDGFEYKGRITHLDDEDILKSGWYGYWGSSSITRSLYIDDVLYTISNSMVKLNDLATLSEINSLSLL